MIIVLTGIDGAGKTTAGRLLARRLASAGHRAVFARNSSGRRSITAWCARRAITPPVRLLDATETSIRCVNVLVSHLRARAGGGVVIMDRYLYCQVALRRARGLHPGVILPLLLHALPTPDIVFHLDVPIDAAYRRIRDRAEDTETPEHLHAFREAYEQLAAFPSFIRIDASNPPERVVADMARELELRGLRLPAREPGVGVGDDRAVAQSEVVGDDDAGAALP